MHSKHPVMVSLHSPTLTCEQVLQYLFCQVYDVRTRLHGNRSCIFPSIPIFTPYFWRYFCIFSVLTKEHIPIQNEGCKTIFQCVGTRINKLFVIFHNFGIKSVKYYGQDNVISSCNLSFMLKCVLSLQTKQKIPKSQVMSAEKLQHVILKKCKKNAKNEW